MQPYRIVRYLRDALAKIQLVDPWAPRHILRLRYSRARKRADAHEHRASKQEHPPFPLLHVYLYMARVPDSCSASFAASQRTAAGTLDRAVY
jgi:hypothetical protein